MKHTKGNWNYHLDTGDESVVAEILTDGLSHWIAAVKVGGGGIDINKEEAEANAKLIAVAPDMIELLKSMNIIFHGYKKLDKDTIGHKALVKYKEIMKKLE